MSRTEIQSAQRNTPMRNKNKERDSVFRWQYALSIVLSLIALFVSLHQYYIAREGVSVNEYNSGAYPEIELDKAYLANSELRPYFYENKHLDSNDPARMRVLALAEMSLDCFQVVLTQDKEHPNSASKEERDEDFQWIADSFKNSEVLRDYMDSHQSWYQKELRDLRYLPH
jgi:hypothetical protein